MSEKITKCYVNRKKEETGENIIGISNSKENNFRYYTITQSTSTRDYMLYLLAQDIMEIEDKIALNKNIEAQYTFILNRTLKGIAKESNRYYYIEKKMTLSKENPRPISKSFVDNITFIQSALNRIKDTNVTVRLVDDAMAIPHMYNGKEYGSKYNANQIDKAWKALDELVPKRKDNDEPLKIERAL